MQERLQSSGEEEEVEEDGLSGKSCGPLYQASNEQLEPNHWSTLLFVLRTHKGAIESPHVLFT